MANKNIAKLIKKIPNWEALPEKELVTAVQQLILAETILPTSQDITAERDKAVDDEARTVYDQRTIMLSVNTKSNRTLLSCVIREAAIVDNEIKERGILNILTVADVTNISRFSPAEQEFILTIQAAIAKFVGV